LANKVADEEIVIKKEFLEQAKLAIDIC